MREIKFRAWAGEEMIDENYNDDHYVFSVEAGKPVVLEQSLDEYGGYSPAVAEIMQYTGLKDKNWKEIYEGDIVDPAGGSIKEIVYIADGWGSGFQMRKSDGQLFSMSDVSNFMVVIGNVHETPELLSTDKT